MAAVPAGFTLFFAGILLLRRRSCPSSASAQIAIFDLLGVKVAFDERVRAACKPGQLGRARREKSGSRSNTQTPDSEYLDGQMLIAMPTMGDERFERAVIYICAHSTKGAMGIIVNQPARNINFPDLLLLRSDPDGRADQLPDRCGQAMKVLHRRAGREPGRRLPFCTRAISSSRISTFRRSTTSICLTATPRYPRRRSRMAAGPASALSWRSVMPAGARASSSTSRGRTAGAHCRRSEFDFVSGCRHRRQSTTALRKIGINLSHVVERGR